MTTFSLASGQSVARLGQGTWRMGEQTRSAPRRDRGIAHWARSRPCRHRHGRDVRRRPVRGADRRSDRGAPRRGVTSSAKCCRTNASRRGTIAACERSLRAAQYGLSRSLSAALAPVRAARRDARGVRVARDAGKIRALGRQQLRPRRSRGVRRSSPGGDIVAANQVLYRLEHRGIEWDSAPWCREHAVPSWRTRRSAAARARCVACLAQRALSAVAARRAASPAGRARLDASRNPSVVVIPKAARDRARAGERGRAAGSRASDGRICASSTPRSRRRDAARRSR